MNDEQGPKAKIPLGSVPFLSVRVGGEWGDRRDLMKRNLLVWYPLARDESHKKPLDVDQDILALWTRRLTPAEMRQEPNSYTGLGKTLQAMIHYTADTRDDNLIAEKDRIVAILLGSQESDGYWGTIKRTPDDPAGALWFGWNVHDGMYLGLALTDNFRFFGHEPSLVAARRYADFVIAHWDKAPKRPGQLTPVGITDFLFALTEATGDAKYCDFIATTPFDGRFIDMESLVEWRQELYPILDAKAADVDGNQDAFATRFKTKVHTYRYFSRLLDQMNLHKVRPRDDLFVMSRYTLAKLRDPETAGLFVTGATGRSEGWVEDQAGRGHVGEACAVVHQVWWLSHLIEADGDLACGDLIERMVVNHLEAAQDPRTGQTRYFVPTSGERNFSKGAHCCDGNLKRFWADIGGLIYYVAPGEAPGQAGVVAVSQYTSSVATLKLGGHVLRISQETQYPTDGRIVLRVEPDQPVRFALRLRIPRWAKSSEITVNGRRVPVAPAPGGIAIEREWKSGDVLRLDLPMDFRWIEGMKFYAGHVALARGPQVFCLASSRNPALKSVADWREITVDPSSVTLLPTPAADSVRRPIEAKAPGWSPGRPTTQAPDLDLIFSDFRVTDGFETYVRLSNPSVAMRDELYEAPDGQSPPAPPDIAAHPDIY